MNEPLITQPPQTGAGCDNAMKLLRKGKLPLITWFVLAESMIKSPAKRKSYGLGVIKRVIVDCGVTIQPSEGLFIGHIRAEIFGKVFYM